MKWIGLTGGIATGKSTASRILRELGFAVIDADQLARQAVQNGTPAFHEIVRVFGPNMVLPDGSLDRKALGREVFGATEKRALLESIVHPEVRRLQKEAREKLAAKNTKIAFYDVPLLFEKNLEKDFDATVVVTCSPHVQLQRLMKRDGSSEHEARIRISAQLPMAEKIKRATYKIQNDNDESELKNALIALIPRLER